jgi:hypothetical protein
MMAEGSLFGHLAFGFSQSPENLGTEALCFILGKSRAANQALVRFIAQSGADLPETLNFETQSQGEESEIPDLIGKDSEGREMVIGEAKFWAGLTGNQPVTYLKRLKKRGGAVLMFIAPEMRFATLWPELVRRTREAKLTISTTESKSHVYRTAQVDEGQVLMLTSWRALLNVMRAAVEAEGDLNALSDIEQLFGLCERMDTEAFLPLRSEELSSGIGKRATQYPDLIDRVTETLAAEGLISLKGLKATPIREGYGRYMVMHDFGCMLQFNTRLWGKYRETPLWLNVRDTGGKYWGYSERIRERLVRLEAEEPSRLVLEDGKWVFVPLYLPVNEEKDRVVDSLVEQMKEIIGLLGAGE